MAFRTRFAPSPTGLLHLGNAFSALIGWQMARASGGAFFLRIEDIDHSRCRPDYADALVDDLCWLGLDWDMPVLRQSNRAPLYAAALQRLAERQLLYPCFCSRADIAAATIAPHGSEGPLYPGTCRALTPATRRRRMASLPFAWRIDMATASAAAGPLAWNDRNAGRVTARPDLHGDIVIGRKEIGTSYHLAVVIDDAAQGITDVVRGADLFGASHVQRLLQALLGLPTPRYHHHPLLLGKDGQRLAKRHSSETLAAQRANGVDPAALRARLLQAATPWPVGAGVVLAHE